MGRRQDFQHIFSTSQSMIMVRKCRGGGGNNTMASTCFPLETLLLFIIHICETENRLKHKLKQPLLVYSKITLQFSYNANTYCGLHSPSASQHLPLADQIAAQFLQTFCIFYCLRYLSISLKLAKPVERIKVLSMSSKAIKNIKLIAQRFLIEVLKHNKWISLSYTACQIYMSN